MIRILIFLIVVFALGLAFAWLADRPGDLVITFGGYQYQVTLMVAAVAGVAAVSAVMITWWILKSIWNSPQTVNRYFRARRRDRGYQSLSTGLIAAGAGDNGLAKKMGKQAAGLLSSDQEPLIHLLEAQTMLLEGNHEGGRKKFEQMIEDPETRLLGLRGLFLEAQRLGEREAARHYAEQAAETAPQLIWASNVAIETRIGSGDWEGALRLVESQISTKQISADESKDRRSVLLTAKALALIDTDPAAARLAALEANKLSPEFVPAALAAGKVLYRQSEIRKGTRILEAIWKRSPHPEIADLYVHARPGDSTQDRLKRAKRLQSLKKQHVESALVVARAANDAGEYREAREAIEMALRLGPRESTYLLLADIEENETGDQGRVRHWLSKAVRAPRDPAWTADGYVSESWAPVSPISGAIGAFEWKVPVERLGAVIDPDEANPIELPVIPEPVIEPESETESGAADAVEVEPATEEAEISTAEEADPVADEPSEPDGQPAGNEEEKPELTDETEQPANEQKAEATPEDDQSVPVADGDEGTGEAEVVPLHKIPDDPGVDEDAPKQQPGRFRLF
ncbi:MAG: heme biosynthesis HemY N-terminal domain-containing protein [Rhizobiaceae bacterium]